MMKFEIEIQDENLTQKGIRAIIDFYRSLAVSELALPEALGFATGIDSPFLNVLFDLRTNIANSKQLIDKANEFFDQYQIPWGWFITPARKENDLEQYGFALLEEAPAMYFSLLNALPTFKSSEIVIEEVDKNSTLEQWIDPINEAFEAKEGDDSYRQLNETALKNYSNKFRHYVAYYQGSLGGAATLFLADEAVMLHNLGVKKDFKNKGIGTALTLHMMEVAKKLGYQDCFLDSSEEAFNLYKKLEFKTYNSTLIYSKINK